MEMMNFTGNFRACVCLLILGTASSAWGVPLQQASVTEAVNSVSYQATVNAPQKPATAGTIIHPDNVVRTGIKSRAELQFNDNTVARMGANSVFTFDAQTQKLNLEQGSLLFSKPKEGGSFEISTPAATCSITGTSGFMEVMPMVKTKGEFSFLFGLLEGHTAIAIDGKSYQLVGGKLLVGTPDGTVRILDFDITEFLAKAGLINKFKSTLPNKKQIDHESKKFASLKERGFIIPTSYSLATDDREIALLGDLRDYYNSHLGEPDFTAQIQFFDIQRQNAMTMGNVGGGGGGGFVGVPNDSIIHGELIWTSLADLDLHLVLPGGTYGEGSPGEVAYYSTTVHFNDSQATATLDHDNTGGETPATIPLTGQRIENITVTGVPSTGTYQFIVHSFNTPNVSDAYTLITTGNNGVTSTTTTGTIGAHQTTTPITVTH